MLLDLDAAACRDPLVAGGKAARLAAARAAGLPALPGVVVPVGAARAALGRGLALAQRGRHHAGQLEVMAAGVSAELAGELGAASARLGTLLAVRSSSPLEAGTVWSGAFSSYLGVHRADLPTAVAGCWASALGTDALGRASRLGVEPARLAPAVLIQPEVDPTVAGTAEVAGDGTVTVVGVHGGPAALLAGWRAGLTVTVRDGQIATGTDAASELGTDAVLVVAALAETVRAAIGDEVVEWAVDGSRGSAAAGVVLLQSARTSRPPATAPAPHPELPPGALRIARLVHRFGDPTGEALVLPWAAALPSVPGPAPVPEAPSVAMDAARALAAELTATAWQAPPAAALASAARTLAELRGPAPGPAVARLERLAAVDPEPARRLLGLLATGGAAGPDRAPRLADRWEPFVHVAVLAHGDRLQGEPAAPGIAAGPVVLVDRVGARGLPRRAVCVARHPLPRLAPLLWGAAALVTAGGSAGAHLIGVAQSLGIPAVVGCDLEPRLAAGRPYLAAVDGHGGAVALTPAAGA